MLFGANYAGQVFALRASNGSYVWQSSTQGLSFGRGGPVYSTPAVAYGRVYLGSIDTRVYSFDEDNGELLWSHSTGDWVYGAPAVADTPRTDPTVYVGSKDQNFYALDAKTGAVRWQKDIGGVILGASTVLGEVVYVAVLGPNVGTFGFDVKTGKKVFESDLGEYNPVISDGAADVPHRELERARVRARVICRAAPRGPPPPGPAPAPAGRAPGEAQAPAGRPSRPAPASAGRSPGSQKHQDEVRLRRWPAPLRGGRVGRCEPGGASPCWSAPWRSASAWSLRPSGSFSPTLTLSAGGQDAASAAVAVGAGGDGVAAWTRFDGNVSRVQARTVSPGGGLGTGADAFGGGQQRVLPAGRGRRRR